MARARAADALYFDGELYARPRKVEPPPSSWVESVLRFGEGESDELDLLEE
jgi:hypothetical protein